MASRTRATHAEDTDPRSVVDRAIDQALARGILAALAVVALAAAALLGYDRAVGIPPLRVVFLGLAVVGSVWTLFSRAVAGRLLARRVSDGSLSAKGTARTVVALSTLLVASALWPALLGLLLAVEGDDTLPIGALFALSVLLLALLFPRPKATREWLESLAEHGQGARFGHAARSPALSSDARNQQFQLR